jgi:YgiT-type zinc finger domain-containing protein
MGKRPQNEEKVMICHICGGELEAVITNLPFKVDGDRIVIIKGLPVLQCANCGEYVIDDPVMEKVDTILSTVDTAVELEILSYVA